jgi:hypothetical protein
VQKLDESAEEYGYRWEKVEANGISGWIPERNLTTNVFYLAPSSSTAGMELESDLDRNAAIVEAVDQYYTNSDDTDSLYSSDDGANNISGIVQSGFPKELFLAMLAQEKTPDSDNEAVTFDFGHGISQATFKSSGPYEKRFDNRGIGSGIIVPPCTTNRDLFRDCYSNNIIAKLKKDSTLDLLGTTDGDGTEVVSNGYYWWQVRSAEFHTDGWIAAGVVGEPPSYAKMEGSGTVQVQVEGLNLRSSPEVADPGYKPNEKYDGQVFKSYANTRQSIYANVKDGLRVLQDKLDWASEIQTLECPKPISGTELVLSCDEIAYITATWLYNGQKDTSGYIGHVADRLENLGDYFTGRTFDNNDQLIEKLSAIDGRNTQILLRSAGTVAVSDSQGNMTGTADGVNYADIPNSVFDEDNERILILLSDDSYIYRVAGQSAGEYSLEVEKYHPEGNQKFQALGIPMGTGNEVHEYSVDWEALAREELGASGQVDYDGDGSFDADFESGSQLGYEEFVISAYRCGDIDLSGLVDVGDAVEGLATLVGRVDVLRSIGLLGDVDGDSRYTIMDVLGTLHIVIGAEVSPGRCSRKG